ncbi:MAG: type II toxin-antitoxin system RelE/ParE family toxin [Neisseriaceae bacterium]|nr:type II toxin-antitoxin system RelE/ParE family toxin [Neisseriaceae bacterium]
MKEYSVVITDKAQQDLREIFEYIAFDLFSPNTAHKQLNRIEKAIQELNFFPYKYKKYEEELWSSRNLHILTVDNYSVFYIPDDTALRVTVIRIMYGGRNIKQAL